MSNDVIGWAYSNEPSREEFKKQMMEYASNIDITIKVDVEKRTATWWLSYKDTSEPNREPVELCTERNLTDERIAELRKDHRKQFRVELDEDLFNV